MSLKAKIEAVIYASEEPVTLAQLTGLLGEEAQAELDALASQQQTLPLDASTPDQDALNDEVLEVSEEPLAEQEAISEADGPEAEAPEPTEAAASEPETAPEPEIPSPVDEKKLAAEKARKLRDYFRSLLDSLIADYANDARGLEIREVAGGYRFATKPEYHDAVRGFVKSLKPPLKLTLQALETLAVVAYKQPVTAPEISEIRGVDSGGVLGSLLARKLITTAGRKQVIGRPILYKTTKDFLLRFGLKDINELPSIEEFEKMAGELADAEPQQEEIPMHAPIHDRFDEAFAPTDDSSPADLPENTGDSPALDERNTAPEPTHTLHDTPEDLMADDSSSPEGARTETGDATDTDPLSDQVEPMATIHDPIPEADIPPGPDGEEEEVDGPESGVQRS